MANMNSAFSMFGKSLTQIRSTLGKGWSSAVRMADKAKSFEVAVNSGVGAGSHILRANPMMNGAAIGGGIGLASGAYSYATDRRTDMGTVMNRTIMGAGLGAAGGLGYSMKKSGMIGDYSKFIGDSWKAGARA